VPQDYSENQELGTWVNTQRRQRLKISKDRAAKLDSIGFTLGTMQDVRWEIIFEELRKFNEREGHCNVPGKYSKNPELGFWVSRQREIRLKMSKERVFKLDSIGFTWGTTQDER